MITATSHDPWVVVTPPPTPNGRLHIGHVAGPFLRADVFVRLIRWVSGGEVYHTSHIDTYQSYVAKKARELGREVSAFRDEMCAGIRDDFRAFGIDHDVFVDNTSPAYLTFLESAAEYLMRRINVTEVQARCCADCESLLFESNVKGYCGECFHDCYQNVCENCCQPQEYARLVEPVCGVCGSRRATQSTARCEQRLTVSLQDVEEVTASMWDRCTGNRRLAALFRNLQPHSIALSYPTDFGVFPTAIQGAMNPWVEIYFAHLYSLFQLCGIDVSKGIDTALASLRSSSTRPRVVYFFGIDNSYYYAFLFTLLSIRLDIPEMLPVAVKANYFLHLNDAKVSSSRNNVIWAHELRAEGSLEELRASLMASCPEFAPRNYQHARARFPTMDRESARNIVKTASSNAFGALRRRVEALTDPAVFSVETLLNTMHKWDRYAAAMRENGTTPDAVREVEAYLSEMTRQLAIV